MPGSGAYFLRCLPLSRDSRALCQRYLTHGIGLAAHAASHAWAETFIEDLGWVGFDPTNRICPTESYIRTATGLDYGEASPVRGVRSGGGVETMRVSVMFPSQHQQQAQ